MATDDDGGPGLDALIARAVLPATDAYYVRIKKADASMASSTYQLGLWLAATPGAGPGTGGDFDDESEPNDEMATADDASASWREVQYLSRTAGTISGAGDADVYAYQFTAGDLVTIDIDSDAPDARVSLLDASGAVVAVEDGTSSFAIPYDLDSPIEAFRIPGTGAYYVKVESRAGAGAYRADVYLSTAAPPGNAAYAALIGTNVQTQMYTTNASAYIRVPFTLEDPTDFQSLTLRIKYNDGFVAYLNGAEVMKRNAPTSVAWNSAATAPRALGPSLVYEDIDITGSLSLLRPGNNVLAIQALSASASDADMLIVPLLVGGGWDGNLNNSGEKISLDSPLGGIIHEFSYGDGWYDQTDGQGFSLTIRDPLQDPSLWDTSDGWRASAMPGGSPGTSDTLAVPGSVVINEVLAHTDPPQFDAIELYNSSSSAVDISGWFLSDSDTQLEKYRIPDDTVLGPGQYYKVDGRDFDITEYAWQSDGIGGVATVEDAGGSIHLTGNGWKRISLRDPVTHQPYHVTVDTWLDFEAKSPVGGLVQGIGLDNDETAADKHADRTFRLYGSNAAWGIGASPAYTTADGWQHFSIRLGDVAEFPKCDMSYLFFANDNDGEIPGSEAQVFFRSVRISKGSPTESTPAVDFSKYFGLNGTIGDDVYLASGVVVNGAAMAGGYRTHVDFTAMPNGVSYGRYTSAGGTDFTLLQTPTLGAANSQPYRGPLVTDEIMYHPSALTAAEQAAGYTDQDDFEFIEIFNRSVTTQDLRDFYVGGGAGFSLGWLDSDADGSESWTLEPGATATWTANLPADNYGIYVRYDLLDATGRKRSLDAAAEYTLGAAKSPTFILDQGDDAGVYRDANGWVRLGTDVYALGGAVSLALCRGQTSDPGSWTIADQVKFVPAVGNPIVVDNPVLARPATAGALTTLAPGDRAVLVHNYAAFDARYHIAENQIPVVGQYSGNLSNAGDSVKIFQADAADPVTGYIPYWRVDNVDYKDGGLWPKEADGEGPAAGREDSGIYGSDPTNWEATGAGGTPGKANAWIDRTPPSVPGAISALVTAADAMALSWGASYDYQSSVDHYVVYRDGVAVGEPTAPSYVNAALQPGQVHSYWVRAVNRDGFMGIQSPAASLAAPGILSFVVRRTAGRSRSTSPRPSRQWRSAISLSRAARYRRPFAAATTRRRPSRRPPTWSWATPTRSRPTTSPPYPGTRWPGASRSPSPTPGRP